MPEPKTALKVFLCHAHYDKVKTRELYRNLRKRGVQPWLDTEDLVGGQDWKEEIPKAITESDAIIICLSKNSISKEGFVQAEITFALDKALDIPPERIFIIPVRFEDCEVPDKLKRYQWVDYFDDDGFRKLMKALKKRAAQLERATVKVPKLDESQPNLASALKQDVPEGEAKDKRGVTEKSVHKAAEHDDIGKSKREKTEGQDTRKDRLTKSLSIIFIALKSALPKAVPLLSIVGVFGIIIALFWAGSWAIPKIFLPVPSATPNISPTVDSTATPPKLISSLTPSKTITPSFTSTIIFTITPSLTPTFVPTPITSNVVIKESDPLPQNCRVIPNTQSEIVEKIASGTNLLAFGRSENSDWLYVKPENNERYCWINIIDGVTYQANEIDQLPVGILYSKGVEMVLVPSGSFIMGKDANDTLAECSKYGSSCKLDWFTDAEVENQIYLDMFYMDKYEVTNLIYRECVTSGVCVPPKQTSLNTVKDYYTNSKYNDYPVVYVDWEMAKTYCEWRGAQLPTEAQWEKAARGTDERIFPWGEKISCEYANYRKLNGDDYCTGLTTKVGNFKDSVSPYGVFDMAGNVWEWVNSLYENYPYNANDGRENPNVPGNRVMRGGSWIWYEYNAFVTNRNAYLQTRSFEDVGFRCARDANP